MKKMKELRLHDKEIFSMLCLCRAQFIIDSIMSSAEWSLIFRRYKNGWFFLFPLKKRQHNAMNKKHTHTHKLWDVLWFAWAALSSAIPTKNFFCVHWTQQQSINSANLLQQIAKIKGRISVFSSSTAFERRIGILCYFAYRTKVNLASW